MKTYSLCLAATLLLTFACKKKETVESIEKTATTNKPAAVTEKSTGFVDEETQFAMAFFSRPKGNQRMEAKVGPCGATVVVDTLPVSISEKNKRVRLTFDANIECIKGGDKIKKQGQIQFQLTKGDFWDEVGAEITKTYANYKEVKVCLDCHSKEEDATFNGSETITNLSGGLIEEAPIGVTLTHELKAKNMTLTFNDNSVRVQNISEIMTGKKLAANEYEFSLVGNGTYEGANNVAMWGNTNGSPYTLIYTSPKTYNTCGGKGKLVSGEALYKKGSHQIVETFGVDKKGVFVGNCAAWGYKVVTTKGNGQTTTEVVKY